MQQLATSHLPDLVYKLEPFDKLSSRELYAILQLRSEVFVVEQNCAYQDLDDLDPDCLHFSIWGNQVLLAYARLLPPGLDFTDSSAIGRVITKASVRGKGVGKDLMLKAIHHCETLWPGSDIKLHAQTYLLQFYRNFGFTGYGEEFLEDGLPHFFMRRPGAK